MVSVHFYDPNEYTLDAKYSEWGHTGAADKKANWGDEDNVKDVFNSLKTTYIDKGIPVYIGEMGCVSRTTDRAESFRKYYLDIYVKQRKNTDWLLFIGIMAVQVVERKNQACLIMLPVII